MGNGKTQFAPTHAPNLRLIEKRRNRRRFRRPDFLFSRPFFIFGLYSKESARTGKEIPAPAPGHSNSPSQQRILQIFDQGHFGIERVQHEKAFTHEPRNKVSRVVDTFSAVSVNSGNLIRKSQKIFDTANEQNHEPFPKSGHEHAHQKPIDGQKEPQTLQTEAGPKHAGSPEQTEKKLQNLHRQALVFKAEPDEPGLPTQKSVAHEKESVDRPGFGG